MGSGNSNPVQLFLGAENPLTGDRGCASDLTLSHVKEEVTLLPGPSSDRKNLPRHLAAHHSSPLPSLQASPDPHHNPRSLIIPRSHPFSRRLKLKNGFYPLFLATTDTQGKSQSKLTSEQVADLQRSTYCSSPLSPRPLL